MSVLERKYFGLHYIRFSEKWHQLRITMALYITLIAQATSVSTGFLSFQFQCMSKNFISINSASKCWCRHHQLLLCIRTKVLNISSGITPSQTSYHTLFGWTFHFHNDVVIHDYFFIPFSDTNGAEQTQFLLLC